MKIYFTTYRVLAAAFFIFILTVVLDVACGKNETLFLNANRTSGWGPGSLSNSRPTWSSNWGRNNTTTTFRPRTTIYYTTPRTTRYTTRWKAETTRYPYGWYPPAATTTTARSNYGWHPKPTTPPSLIRTTTSRSGWYPTYTTTNRPFISTTTGSGWANPYWTTTPQYWTTIIPKYYPPANIEKPIEWQTLKPETYPNWLSTTPKTYYPVVTYPTRPFTTRHTPRPTPRTRPTLRPRFQFTTEKWHRKNGSFVWSNRPSDYDRHVSSSLFKIYPHQITDSYYSPNPYVGTAYGNPLGYHFATYHDYYYNHPSYSSNSYTRYLYEQFRQHQQQNTHQNIQQNSITELDKRIDRPIIYSYMAQAANDSSEIVFSKPYMMIGLDGLIILCQFEDELDISLFISYE